MEYLIKDLSAMTGLSPARIRKWQERYHILEPRLAQNGYWYYSNEDFFVLRNISRRLGQGQSLAKILEAGRANLLEVDPGGAHDFSPAEWSFLQDVGRGEVAGMRNQLARQPAESFEAWQTRLSRAVVLVGAGWERGFLSVADEHAFSAWFSGFYRGQLEAQPANRGSDWLVVSFPGDEHTLGALLRFGELIHNGVPARFCGMLPEKELFTELYSHEYRHLSISVVMPRPEEDLENLRGRIQERFPQLQIDFGGPAVKNRTSDTQEGDTK